MAICKFARSWHLGTSYSAANYRAPPFARAPPSPLPMLRSLLLLSALAALTEGHYMWMRHAQQDNASMPECIVTFAEGAGSAEGLPLLEMVANKTSVLTEEHGAVPVRLNLSVTVLGEEGAALEAPIRAKPPYMMRLTTNFGFFEPLKMQLVYTATAPSVTRPYDWQAIDAQAGSRCGGGVKGDPVHSPHPGEGCGLEITLRDPYMLGASPGEGVLLPPFPETRAALDPRACAKEAPTTQPPRTIGIITRTSPRSLPHD